MTAVPTYAFFDFDKTLISKDSFLLLLKYGFVQQPWRLIFIMLLWPILLLSALLRWDKALPKSMLLWSVTCFKGKKGSAQFFKQFVAKHMDLYWFKQVEDEFQKLRKENIEIVVISASGAYWVRHALAHMTKSPLRLVIGSQLGFFMGGVIYKSKNCYKEEKIQRIDALLGKNFTWHSSYSDHIADLPLLKKACHRFLVNPTQAHLPTFKCQLQENYTILSWTCVS